MSDTFIGDQLGQTDDVSVIIQYRALYGIAGDDTLATGYTGFAYFEGGEGSDDLSTEVGLDTIANTYADFYGGSGNDFISGGCSSSVDYIYGGVGDDIVDQKTIGSGGDNIFGGQGRDSLSGAKGNDKIFGDEGDDSGANITAGAGNHVAKPGLFGGAGDDYLDGGRGRDLLSGGADADLLMGGLDKDTFSFGSVKHSTPKARDTILDFHRGDKIDLDNIDAKTGGGNQDFDFIGGQQFSGDKGELRFSQGLLSGDTDGDGKADFQVKVLGVNSLKDSDFDL